MPKRTIGPVHGEPSTAACYFGKNMVSYPKMNRLSGGEKEKRTMVKKGHELPVQENENMRGGDGTIVLRHFLNKDEFYGKERFYVRNETENGWKTDGNGKKERNSLLRIE